MSTSNATRIPVLGGLGVTVLPRPADGEDIHIVPAVEPLDESPAHPEQKFRRTQPLGDLQLEHDGQAGWSPRLLQEVAQHRGARYNGRAAPRLRLAMRASGARSASLSECQPM